MNINQKVDLLKYFTSGVLLVLAVAFTLPATAEQRKIKKSPKLRIQDVQPRLILRPVKTDVDAVKALVKRQATLPRTLRSSERQMLNAIVHNISSNNLGGAVKRWRRLVMQLAKTNRSMDINILIQWTLRQAYHQHNEELQLYARKVSYLNQLKKILREEIAEMRERATNLASARVAKINMITLILQQSAIPHISRAWQTLGKNAIENYIQQLEGYLSSIGDIMQLAQLQLQDTMNRQSQAVQALSAIMKSFYDTAKAIIRNMRS